MTPQPSHIYKNKKLFVQVCSFFFNILAIMLVVVIKSSGGSPKGRDGKLFSGFLSGLSFWGYNIQTAFMSKE